MSTLLEVDGLAVDYPRSGGPGWPGRRQPGVPALRGVSLSLARGETLGLVGESGSGKSTLGRAILGLVRPGAGRIVFAGRDITHAGRRERRALATRLQVVFQDTRGSLSPVRTVGHTLAEPLRAHRRLPRAAVAERVRDMLHRVGLPPELARRYPGELSGGQQQRVAIARALILEPDLVVCDEPTSSLDLSVQAQVLNLLLDLQRELGVSYLFISHDIAVVRHLSHRVAVLLGGQLMDVGETAAVTDPPRHPYTAALLDAAPVPDPARQAQRRAARRPALRDARPGPGPGCPFAGRCPAELEACRTVPPPVPTPDGGAIACHAYRALPAAAVELPDQGAA